MSHRVDKILVFTTSLSCMIDGPIAYSFLGPQYQIQDVTQNRHSVTLVQSSDVSLIPHHQTPGFPSLPNLIAFVLSSCQGSWLARDFNFF